MSSPPLLDYQPVEPLRRSTVRIGTLLGFSIAFAMTTLAVLNLWGPNNSVSLNAWRVWSLKATGVVTLGTAFVFVVTTILRRSCARPPCHYRGMIATLAAGVSCAVVPTMLGVALPGRTNPVPWLFATWLIATIGASFAVYASFDGEVCRGGDR